VGGVRCRGYRGGAAPTLAHKSEGGPKPGVQPHRDSRGSSGRRMELRGFGYGSRLTGYVRAMLVAGTGISTLLDPVAAARQATELALSRLGSEMPGAVLVLASAAHGHGLLPLVRTVADQVGPDRVVGASVEGVVARGVEVTDNPIVSVLALAGVDAEPFLLEDLAGREPEAGEDIASLVGGPGGQLRPSDLVVFFADLHSLRHGPLLRGFEEHVAPATIVGAAAAPVGGGGPLLWHRGEAAPGAVAGLMLRPRSPARIQLTHACRPVTGLMTITRARGSWIVGLEGESALEVHERVGRENAPGPAEKSGLLLGIERSDVADREAASPTDISGLTVRNIVGFDAERGAFSVPDSLPVGSRVALLMPDAATATAALARELAALAGAGSPEPRMGLYFNCRERGAALFGQAGVEATQLANAFPNVAVSGAVSACQFAPARPGGPLELLTYTGVLTLVDG
jgi:small ligand-binding sensory domain FIST